MSGLWSFRTPASTAGSDSVPQLVREALPLATLNEQCFTRPEWSDTYNDEEFDRLDDSGDELYSSDDVKDADGSPYDESHSAWLNRVAAQFDVSSDGINAESLVEIERVLLETRAAGGSLHQTLLHGGSTPVFPTSADDSSRSIAPEAQRLFETLRGLDNPTVVRTPPQVKASMGKPPLSAASSSAQFKAAQQSAEAVKRREALRDEARATARASSRARQEAQKATRREAKAVLERLQHEQNQVADELERRKCLQAITNIQRAHTAVRVHQEQSQRKPLQRCMVGLDRQAPPKAPTQQYEQGLPKHVASTSDARAELGAKTAPQPSVSAAPRATRDCNRAIPRNASAETLTAGPSVSCSHRDPWQRLLSSTARREAEIDALRRAGRVVLDPRETKEKRLQSVSARPTAQAVQQAALSERVAAHNRLRMLRHYAWQPWRKAVLIEKCLTNHAHSHCRRTRLLSSLRAWRLFAMGAQRTRGAVQCARIVALIRFLWFCWKRRIFLAWRSKSILRRAHEREADRFRRRTVWNAWAFARYKRQQEAARHVEAVADQCAMNVLRRTKRNAFRKWREAADSRAMVRARTAFRNTLRDAMSDSVLLTGASSVHPPAALEYVPAFLQRSHTA